MLIDNPLLTLLGRRGRSAIVEALRRAPGRTWTVRDLARSADVPSVVASRALRELSALRAVDFLRPGRNAQVRFRPDTVAGRFLAAFEAPDLRDGAAWAFAAALRRVPGLVQTLRYTEPDEDPADPLAPVRVALVTARDEEAVLEAAGPALDAVREAGWPPVQVATFPVEVLRDAGDPVARAVLAGRPLPVK